MGEMHRHALLWPVAIIGLFAAYALIPGMLGMVFGWAAVMTAAWRGSKLFSTPAGGMRDHRQ
jgi:hypothetical protein